MPARAPEEPNTVFLNIPYDRRFRPLYLAYIAGLVKLGMIPRATLEIPGTENRLSKIVDLLRSCRYSVHDLSWVRLDGPAPRTPRFNMPFELGLAIAIERFDPAHRSFVFEARKHRLAKSLSDLGGADAHIHGRSVSGVLRELGNAFVRPSSAHQPSVPEMMHTYRGVLGALPEIELQTGSQDLYTASAFRLLCVAARKAAALSGAN